MRWCAAQSRHVFVEGFIEELKRLFARARGFGERIDVAELSSEPDFDTGEQTVVVALGVAENSALRLLLYSHRNLAPSGMRRQHPLLSCHGYPYLYLPV